MQKFELGTTIVVKANSESTLPEVWWLSSGWRPSSLRQSGDSVILSFTLVLFPLRWMAKEDKNLVVKTLVKNADEM